MLMPGVPHEMKAMWTESVRPLLLARQNCTLHSVTLRVLGGESNLEYRVKHLLENANPTAAIYCKTGECEDPHHGPGLLGGGRRKNVPRIRHKVL